MFGNKPSRSMLDAVNKVLLEEPKDKKRMITDAEMDETGFHKAAHAAKRANQTHFEFQGKKYPVTAKSHKEGYVDDIVAKARASGMNAKVVTKADKERDLQAVIDRQKKAKEKAASNPPSDSMIGKGRDSFGPNKGYGQGRYMGDSVEVGSFAQRLLEREMTSGEKKKREKIVMSMKDKTEYFKKKYGKNWKNVMYATATKNAMGEEVEEMDEGMMDTMKKVGSKVLKTLGHGDDKEMRKDLQRKMGMKPTGEKPMKKEEVEELDETTGVTDYNPKSQGGTRKELLAMYAKSGDPKHAEAARKAGATQSELKTARVVDSMFGHRGGVDKLGIRKEEVELAEKNDSHTHAAHYENEKGEWTGMNLFTAKDDDDAIKQAQSKCKEGCRLSKVERHTTVKEEIESLDEIDRNALYHKLQAHIANKNKAYSADKAREFSGGKLRDAGEKKTSLDKHVAGIKKAQRTLGKVTAKPHNIKSEEFTEAKDPHIDAGVGAQPNEAMGHTPLTRAKEMARNAMNRVKTEMLGKAPGNN